MSQLHKTFVVAAALAAAAMASPRAEAGEAASPDPGVAPFATHRVIVKVHPGVTPAQPDGRWSFVESDADPVIGTPTASPGDLADELARWNVISITPGFFPLPANAELAEAIGLDRYWRVNVPQDTETAALVASLARWTDLFEDVDVDGAGGVADTVPDDTDFINQYAMLNSGQPVQGQTGVAGADIDATLAWDITTGSGDILLAVLDSGMNSHTELSGRIVPGWNVVSDSSDTSDACVSHGTHVTGIAAANGDNTLGVAGMNWLVQVMPVRILNGCGGFESDLADGIVYAVDNGADIINMSLQFGTGSQTLHDAVTYAYLSDVPMLAASGNNGFTGGVAYPGRWPETIAVAGTDNQDDIPNSTQNGWTSNAGQEVDVAAPGDDIRSLTNLIDYGYKSGTSMATPHVSGLVGLMLTLDPSLTTEEIRTILHDTAEDVSAPGFDIATGHGRINAHAALLAVQAGLSVPGDANADGTVNSLDIVAVILSWGPCPAPCAADLDGSGLVDVSDLVQVILNWPAS